MTRGSTATVQTTREAGVLTRATLRAAGALGLAGKDLAVVLGVSEASVSRLARGRAIDPSTKEGELALLLLRLYRSLDALVGGSESKARIWLAADNAHLAGRPVDRIRSITGLVHVIEYLDALRGKS